MISRVFLPEANALPIYFVSTCYEHRQENINRPSGVRNIMQLLFVLDGEGTLECGGVQYPLTRGSAFYLEQGVPHRYWSDGSLVTAWITYCGSGCEELRHYIGDAPFLFSPHTHVKKYVSQIEQIEREYFDKKREGYLSAMTYSLVLSFFEDLREPVLSDMDRVLRYMEANFDHKITVLELATLLRVSRSTFCKRFKDSFGCTAFEKLIDIRLLNAERMLHENVSEKIAFIAKRCGFDDVSYFCRLYKKRFSVTPREAQLRG